ncbi:MAG: WbqC family protein [Prolixibacteraceae bacterium]
MVDLPVLLSTAYFAPVNYYARILKHQPVYIEQFEHFNKQTYRNRCVILGPNGVLPLVVPVIKGRLKKILIKDLKIAYDEDWQRNHWRSLFSAYNSSPFFEFYQDEIIPLFETKFTFLLDLNSAIHQTVCSLLEMNNNFILTTGFEKVPPETLNFREKMSPKNKKETDADFHPVSYTQVFDERFGFVPNLSILDLLFNEGPNSYSVLQKSIAAD